MTRDEFKRQLQELRDKVFLEALAYYVIWQALCPSGEEPTRTMNRYIGFFGPVRRVLWEMMFIQLAKLFDRDPRAINLWRLLGAAKEDVSLVPHAAQGELERVENQLVVHEKTLQALKQLRDQHLAHLDASPARHRSIPKDDFDPLVEGIKWVFLHLAWVHDRWGWDWSSLSDQSMRDVTEVFQVLREKLTAEC